MDSYDETGSAGDLSVDARSVNLFDFRGQFAFAKDPVVTTGGQFAAVLLIGGDATYASDNGIDATLLGQSLSFNVSDEDATYRGFSGLDLVYRMDGGASVTLSGEAGHGSSDAVTLAGTASISWSF